LVLRRSALAVLAALASFALPRPAPANMAAVQRDPGTLGALDSLAATPLAVDEERLDFDCTGGEPEPQCTFEAVYVVRNPTDQPQSVTAAFLGLYTEAVTIRIDGAEVSAALSAAEIRALDDAVLGERTAGPLVTLVRDRARHYGFTLDVPPGTTREVRATGTVRAPQRFQPETWFPAAATRHLLLGREVGGNRGGWFDLRYLLAPLNTWAGEPRVTVVVRRPAGWSFAAQTSDAPEEFGELPAGPPPGWESAVDGETATETWRSGGPLPAVLDLGFGVGESEPFFSGGAVLGFGGTVGAGGGDFWMRIGYELAYPGWLLYSVNVDTNYIDRVVVAPQLEVATPLPYMPIFPSLDVGLGLPIQALPELLVGIRFLCGFTWGPVGFNATFDIYPSLDTGDADFLQLGLLGMIVI
jgi:hypothetical protein